MRSVREQVLKSKAMQVTERRIGEPLETYLERRYVVDGTTLAVIAADLGINVSTASRWLAQLGIEARFTGPRPRTEAVA